MTSKVGFVVPTLGNRNELLSKCLESLFDAGVNQVVVVAPKHVNLPLGNSIIRVDDKGEGIARAINQGMQMMNKDVEFVSWIGDDDYLIPSQFYRLVTSLEDSPDTTLAFGNCEYVDAMGRRLMVNKFGELAKWCLHFGPNLLPQPSSLFRISDFRAVGGLNEKYELAFDLELFLKLKNIGRLKYVPYTTGAFRWHADSLTVSSRRKSVLESSKIRRSQWRGPVRLISFFWEIPTSLVQYSAGFTMKLRNLILSPKYQ